MNIRSLGFVNGIAIIFVTVVASTALAPSVRADHAENAFVIVEGEGVVRLDGKNFAVLSSGENKSLVKVTAQPGWELDTPSSAFASVEILMKMESRMRMKKLCLESKVIQAIQTYSISHYETNGDNEARCLKQEIVGHPVFFEERDWANPGCQSKDKFGPTN